MNVGEQLVSSYLRYIRKCDFIQTNLYTVDVQGEIDVVGINLREKKVYICEVAIHLTTGLQYVKDKRPNNVNKLVEKFTQDIAYARRYLADYSHEFMLWSHRQGQQGEPAVQPDRPFDRFPLDSSCSGPGRPDVQRD
ncbi:hypothetical protein WKW77_34640 [Variovorax ureilyticus]|uniref:Uncharacterized protein n=1 Tax=Variovorax ureilyticus TaxID=1836198 RepID=A0ABU8VRE3_9BURK